MTGLAIQAMQFEMFLEARLAHKSLECGILHLRRLGKAHVIVDQRQNLFGVIVRKPKSPADFFRHLHANGDMAIETNSIWRHAKCCGFADIVQERAPGHRRGTGLRQFLQQQQGMVAAVANPLFGE